MDTLAKRYGEIYLQLCESINSGRSRSPACREEDERLLDKLEQEIDLRGGGRQVIAA